MRGGLLATRVPQVLRRRRWLLLRVLVVLTAGAASAQSAAQGAIRLERMRLAVPVPIPTREEIPRPLIKNIADWV